MAPAGYTKHSDWPINYGAWYIDQILGILVPNPEVFSKTVLILNCDEAASCQLYSSLGEFVQGRRRKNFSPYLALQAWAGTPGRGVVVRFESSHPAIATESIETCFAESHAAAVKHSVITIEKTIGRIKRYRQLTTVMAAKQRANAHAVPRISAKVAVGRPPSCHANIAANR